MRCVTKLIVALVAIFVVVLGAGCSAGISDYDMENASPMERITPCGYDKMGGWLQGVNGYTVTRRDIESGEIKTGMKFTIREIPVRKMFDGRSNNYKPQPIGTWLADGQLESRRLNNIDGSGQLMVRVDERMYVVQSITIVRVESGIFPVTNCFVAREKSNLKYGAATSYTPADSRGSIGNMSEGDTIFVTVYPMSSSL